MSFANSYEMGGLARRFNPDGFLLPVRLPSDDPVWQSSHAARMAFFTEMGRQGKLVLTARVLAGRDRHGQAVAPLGSSTIDHRRRDVSWFSGEAPYSPMGKSDPSAPPDVPNRERSRIISLLTYQIRPDGPWFYWRLDPSDGGDWTKVQKIKTFVHEVLTYRGRRTVPGRDQRGFTPQEQRVLDEFAQRWWQANRRRWDTEPGVTRTPPPGRLGQLGSAPPPEDEKSTGLFGRLAGAVGGAISRAVNRLTSKATGYARGSTP